MCALITMMEKKKEHDPSKIKMGKGERQNATSRNLFSLFIGLVYDIYCIIQ